MLDTTTLDGRVVDATLTLAAHRPWGDVTMAEIAHAASTDLAALRKAFPSKSAILARFVRAVDDAVLSRASRPDPAQPARDRLFEVVMSRFDVLTPYKAALKSISAARPLDWTLLQKVLASQAWMLHAAGIGTDGLRGRVRVAGLASVYARVLDTWLSDEDPGNARTMAALDRSLKRGEQAMTSLDDVCGGLSGLAQRLGRACRSKPAPAASPPSQSPGPAEDGPLGYGRP